MRGNDLFLAKRERNKSFILPDHPDVQNAEWPTLCAGWVSGGCARSIPVSIVQPS
jgi:hypothetical protein